MTSVYDLGMMNSFKEIRKSFKNHVRLYKSLLNNPNTPWFSKVLFWIALGYFFLPFDLIPDFIPILGQLDDIVIIPALIYCAIRLTPKALYAEEKKKIFGSEKL